MASLFDEDTPGWVRWTLAGGAAVIVALVALVALLVIPKDHGTAGSDEPTATPTTSSSASSSVCGLPDGDQTMPTSAPGDAGWQKVENVFVASSSTYGPGTIDGRSRTCFAHNPLGAVFAVINLANEPGAANPTAAQFAGFRVDDYSSSRATIELVLRTTQGASPGTFIAMVGPVEWKDGDWALVNPGDNFQVSQVASLSGYIAFGPGAS